MCVGFFYMVSMFVEIVPFVDKYAYIEIAHSEITGVISMNERFLFYWWCLPYTDTRVLCVLM